MRKRQRSRREELADLRATQREKGATTRQVAHLIRARYKVNSRVAYRYAQGLTQQQVADAWNMLWPPAADEATITHKHLSYWEAWPGPSGRAPSPDVLNRLARIYQTSAAELLDGEDHTDRAEFVPQADASLPRPDDLQTGGEETVDAPRLVGANIAGSGAQLAAGDDHAEANIRRRILLQQAMAALAAGTVGTSAALEVIRGGLNQALAGHTDAQRDADDWSELAWDYGEAYLTTAPQALVVDIAADLADIEQVIDQERDGGRITDLSRVTAQLATLMAMSLVNLGQLRAARRWWRTARKAADASRDSGTQAWVRSEEAIRALYTRRGPQAAIDLADEALAIGGRGHIGKALASKAQALAVLGRQSEARNVVRMIEPALEDMPDTIVNDDHTAFGWPEHCLRHTESFVYSHIGDAAAAGAAQQRALTLYPPTERRARALVQLHEAMCLVNDGHIDEGTEHAARTITALPGNHRTTLVQRIGQRVFQTVPHRERSRTSVAGLFDVLALPPGDAAHHG